MMKKSSIFPIYIFLASLIAIPLLFQGCIEDEEEVIFIEYNIPESMTLGDRDTLYFKITTTQSIDTVKVKENEIVYATFDSRTFGAECYLWEVSLLYNPATAGNKSMEFWVKAGGVSVKNQPFTINVVE